MSLYHNILMKIRKMDHGGIYKYFPIYIIMIASVIKIFLYLITIILGEEELAPI